jgi:agmatinase
LIKLFNKYSVGDLVEKIKYILPPARMEIPWDYTPTLKGVAQVISSIDEVDVADAAIIGVPFLGATTFKIPRDPLAPAKGIRKWISTYRVYSSELDCDISEVLKIVNLGDIDLSANLPVEENFERITYVLTEVQKRGMIPIILGGDHAITYPCCKALRKYVNKRIGLIWFDTHFDNMDEMYGSQLMLGTAGKRVLESEFMDGLPVKPENMVYIGLRGFQNSKKSWEAAKKAGITIFTMDDIEKEGITRIVEKAIELAKSNTKSFYTTVDMDVMDAIYIPGHITPQFGGLTPKEITKAVRMVGIAGCSSIDIAEVVPELDVADMTQRLAALIVMEFLAGITYSKIN